MKTFYNNLRGLHIWVNHDPRSWFRISVDGDYHDVTVSINLGTLELGLAHCWRTRREDDYELSFDCDVRRLGGPIMWLEERKALHSQPGGQRRPYERVI